MATINVADTVAVGAPTQFETVIVLSACARRDADAVLMELVAPAYAELADEIAQLRNNVAQQARGAPR